MLGASQAAPAPSREDILRRAKVLLAEKRANRERYDADLEVFARDCLTIRPKEGADRLLRFNDVQRLVHDEIEQMKTETGMVRAIILKARQHGVSTYISARFYHRVSRNPGLRAFVLTHEQDATNNLFTMVKRFHEHNPHAPKTGASSSKELQFAELDSGFDVGTAGTRGVGRSYTIQLFHWSEVAFSPNAEDHSKGIMQAIARAPGTEIVLESTANGLGGLFYNMSMAALRGQSEYRLIFLPWFIHEEYQAKPPQGWEPPQAFLEYAAEHSLTREQLYWAYVKNADMAAADGKPGEEIFGGFRQEYPTSALEAFRASRQGSFISGDVVLKARGYTAPPQRHAPLLLGCDIATGGDGEGGDENVFIDRQGRAAGRLCYESFVDKNTVSVADKLAAQIDWLQPDMVFIDRGGGGAAVYDILKDRNYKHLTLVDFGAGARDPRKYRNKRVEMWGEMRDWLGDVGGVDIPDDDVLDGDLTAPKAKPSGYRTPILLESKDIVRKELGRSPDRGDALCTTWAAPIPHKRQDKATAKVVQGDTRAGL